MQKLQKLKNDSARLQEFMQGPTDATVLKKSRAERIEKYSASKNSERVDELELIGASKKGIVQILP